MLLKSCLLDFSLGDFQCKIKQHRLLNIMVYKPLEIFDTLVGIDVFYLLVNYYKIAIF